MIASATCFETEELIFEGNPAVYSAEGIPGREQKFYVSGVAEFASGQEVLYLYKDGSWHFQAIADGHDDGYFDSREDAEVALATALENISKPQVDMSVIDAQVAEAREDKASWRS